MDQSLLTSAVGSVLLISVWSLVDKCRSHQHRCVTASSDGTRAEGLERQPFAKAGWERASGELAFLLLVQHLPDFLVQPSSQPLA